MSKNRTGCGLCAKIIGKFQYRKIGLCGQCRTRVAKRHGIKKNRVTVDDVIGASWYENANDSTKRDYGVAGAVQ